MTLDEFLRQWHDGSPTLTVRTSGSTGAPKPLCVEKQRMRASAERTCQFLGLTRDDAALLCMPLDYIAGKMVVVRCLVSGMRLLTVPPSSHPLKGLEEQPTFVAMVPLQVSRTLQVEEERERLRRVRHLIIGGGAVDAALEEELRRFPNAVWSTYGMTETLSHIALRRINGSKASLFYTPMAGVETRQMADGCLEIYAPAICEARLQTHDIVEMAPDGRRFRILGRKDNVIDSGGIKIQTEQVEALLMGHLPVRFAITKCPDRELGERVVLALERPATTLEVLPTASLAQTAEMENYSAAIKNYSAVKSSFTARMENAPAWVEEAKATCAALLPKYWRPKTIVLLDRIPLTETGKIARKELETLVRG